MDYVRESYIDLNTTIEVARAASGGKVTGKDYVAFEFPINETEMAEWVNIYNIPLKAVFGKHYKTVSLFRCKTKVVLTLLPNAISDGSNSYEGELKEGSILIDLRRSSDDDKEVVFSFSSAKGQPPTLLEICNPSHFKKHGQTKSFRFFMRVALFIVLLMFLYVSLYYD